MARKPGLTGPFHFLRVLEYVKEKKRYRCRCVCGNVLLVLGASLKEGRTKSCGCKRIELLRQAHTTHGQTKTPVYCVWQSMLQRCRDKNCPSYHRYGAKGITVCERWSGKNGFHNFLADMGERPEGAVLDRRKNHLGYFPENCRWVDKVTSTRNRDCTQFVTANGQTKTVTEWAQELGISPDSMRYRLRNWPADDVTLPRTYGVQSEAEKKLRKSARKKVQTALASGRLVKPALCELDGCRELVTDAHHRDYRHPLRVTWMCHDHHKAADRQSRRDQVRSIA